MNPFYLVDNNVLSRVSVLQRGGRFFRDSCRIPSEVLFEARGYLADGELKDIEFPVTVKVLEALSEIMESIPSGDIALVDLYANKGAADPLLVACAIAAMRENEQLLFGPDWVVVSDDKAVVSKAVEFGVATISGGEFASILARVTDA